MHNRNPFKADFYRILKAEFISLLLPKSVDRYNLSLTDLTQPSKCMRVSLCPSLLLLVHHRSRRAAFRIKMV